MKKIIFSSAMIIAVAAIVVTATTAYFSDTETSTGNTFSAGSLDLQFQVGGAAAEWADVDGNPLFDGVAFPLGDLKPGDQGEKTVRLWVDDNPSCGTVSVDVYEDMDNDCTEPEVDDDPTCSNPNGDGELNDAVNWAIWLDQGVNPGFQGPEDLSECDNDYIAQYEPMLTSGTITEDKMYGFGELPTTVETANCYGIAYCVGNWVGDTCDGTLVNNASQSDSFKADLIINALQKRNQYDEGCPTGDMEID
ncbi:MAG: SipW-dependent-type signal peptide-containing protein [Patescibacteria group bacterium]|nr:SipW-dependent-type signal peptide-containing protein [Patescibacteria group bacterium]